MSETASDRPVTPHHIVPTGPSTGPSTPPASIPTESPGPDGVAIITGDAVIGDAGSTDAAKQKDDAAKQKEDAAKVSAHTSDAARDKTDAAREKADAAKDTASAMFGEMKAAVTGASKREPYPWLALASAVAAIVWLIWPEDDKIGAQNLKLWTVFVALSVALVFTPMVR